MYRKCVKRLKHIERIRIPPTVYGTLRLHRLERPEPWDEELRRELYSNWPVNTVNFYPSYPPFIERLASFSGVLPDQIVLGAGIEDFIRSLIILCCDPGEQVMFPWPTCAMFDIHAKIAGAKVRHILNDPDNPPTVDDYIANISKRTRLVILPNPGQPVDTYFLVDELEKLADALAAVDAILAVDEAYYGFGTATAMPMIEKHGNVIVMRTFSKAFGGAGLRLAWAMGCREVLAPLEASRLSGEVAGPSMLIGSRMIDNWYKYIVPGINRIVEGRDWLRDTLNASGYSARGSNANHVLIDMGTKAECEAIVKHLEANNVRVKSGFPKPLDRHLLVTCGSRSLMESFYLAFIKA